MKLALFGDLLDVVTAPPPDAALDEPPPGVRWRPAHWLLIEDGRIAAIQTEPPGPGWTREERAGQLILPGFIDTHVHAPQLDVIASWGAGLLDWLETYTFPAEHSGRHLGQIQRWFLVRTVGDAEPDLDAAADDEFRSWRWAEPEAYLDRVVDFKGAVYLRVIDWLRSELDLG